MRRIHKISFDQVLQIPSVPHLHIPEIKFLNSQVRSSIPTPFSFSINDNLFAIKIQSLMLKPFAPNQRFLFHTYAEHTLNSSDELNKTHKDFTLIEHSGIAKAILFRCSCLSEKKGETFAETSVHNLLLKLFDISPETIRRFRRFSTLKPEDVLEILLGFELYCGKPAIEARKVELLWKLFEWATNQSKDFNHLPKSCEIMVSMLIQAGWLREAASLLRTMELQGILLGGHEVFNKIIERYTSAQDLENSISIYNDMKARGLAPSLSCYLSLLNLLVQKSKSQLAFRVCMDMLEVGFKIGSAEMSTLELVIRLLCKDGKIQETRNLVKKITASGSEPSLIVLNEIANGYCEKKDFEDLLNFLYERNCAPDVLVCNKIVSSLCSNFGSEKAFLVMKDLEYLGVRPDEITFGILIGWSCREGQLKDAFIYLSEISSRCLKPDRRSYNALIGAMFKEGMWKHAGDILVEMVDQGVNPDLSTYKVLLAGYCKERQFDKAKEIVGEMANHGLIQLSSSENPLSDAFMLLGLNPLAVKVKRDNDVGLSKTEFFDALGNGLYLETDLEEYEKTVMGVLEDSMIPDFNQLVLKECGHGNIETALMMKDEIVRWGQKFYCSAYASLMKGLCASHSHIKVTINLLEEVPEQADELDQETLNLLVRKISRKGFTYNGRIILDGMLQRDLPIDNETYTALIVGLCKEGNQKELDKYWELARKHSWLPRLKDCKILVGCLCKCGMLRETLELLESMLETDCHLISEICGVFLEKLCTMGFTSIGRILVEEVLGQDWVLDQAACCHLLRGFFKEKRYDESFGILDIMLEKNMTPCVDLSSLFIPLLCKFHRLEKAMALKEFMYREQPTLSLSVYNAFMNGLCKTGKVGDAAFQFQEMLTKGIQPDTETYNMMVQGFCQVNSLRKAGELLGIMIRKNFSLSPLSYRNLVRLMCVRDMVLNALRLKEIMLRETECPFVVVYNILIYHLFQTGNNLHVTTLLDEMDMKGLVLDEVTYNFLVYGYYHFKDNSRMVEVLKTMIEMNLRPSNRSLKMVISHLCSEGELDKALELSRVMELRGWVHGSVVQNAIVEGLLFTGRLGEAELFLDRMEEKGLIPDSISYDILIRRFCMCGRLNKAVVLLNIMLKKGNLPNPASYDSVIQGLCASKTLDQALDFHYEMLDRKLKPSIASWDVLVHGLCEYGRTAEAELLLDSMLQLGQTPTRNMYRSVINKYRLENKLNKASELLHGMQQNGYMPDFETHWSLISTLSNSNYKDSNEGRGFLSKLLSHSGFIRKKDSKGNVQ